MIREAQQAPQPQDVPPQIPTPPGQDQPQLQQSGSASCSHCTPSIQPCDKIKFGNLPWTVFIVTTMPILVDTGAAASTRPSAEQPEQPAPGRRANLPLDTHPLYGLRKWTLEIGAGSAVFCILLAIGRYSGDVWFVLVTIVAALLFVLWDLITWALHKVSEVLARVGQATVAAGIPVEGLDPNEEAGITAVQLYGIIRPLKKGEKEYSWPNKKLIVFDLLFGLWFVYCSVMMFFASPYYYRSFESVLWPYWFLALFVHGVLHLVAFWKELMARCKARWISNLPRCEHCGNPPIAPASERRPEERREHRHREPMPPRWTTAMSGAFHRTPDLEAGDPDAESETSLLIHPTPDESSNSQVPTLRGYGTVADSVKSLNSECEEVVKKKSKRRMIGEDWMEEGSSRV